MRDFLPGDHCNLNFHKTVSRWDEAIPLGNGLCGALIWGPSDGLRMSLDRGDIWDSTPYPGVRSKEYTYANMVRLAKEKNIDKIREIFDAPYNHILPTKLPAGKLIFDFGPNQNVESRLTLATAEAMLHIGNVQVRSFLHAENKLGYVAVNRKPDAFSFRIENPRYSVGQPGQKADCLVDSVSTSSLELLTYDAPEICDLPERKNFTQKISDAFSYGIFTRLRETEEGTLIVYYVGSSHDGADWKETAEAKLEEALQHSYEDAFESHCQWWSRYWEKSGIGLPDPLFEKQWYLTQYFLGSCSRKGCFPMPLQGVWTADDGALPPWKGDYHHDLNTEMSYYSYLKANHLEEGESFIDYLWDMAQVGRDFARSFYHSQGICMPSTMTLQGESLGGWGMYSLSPTNQLWLCQVFERYYRFTGDLEFLKTKAYPYMQETAQFILGLLEERDGMYYLPISSSPEIHDDNIESFLTPNSNYDLSLMRYLFMQLVHLSEELKNGEAQKWQAVLDRLPELAVNEDNVLMLSPDESLTESHRHFAHAMAIHPLRLMPYEGERNRQIIDATILNLEALGNGYWVGFSVTWMAEFYAIQRNGNGAAYQLQVFWNNHCSQNGFHLNGDYKKRGTSTFHYRPFTLEGNFCAADALQEMLLQSEDGTLTLFPAIPDEWQEETLSFRNFRAERGMLVSATMEKGRVVSLTLQSDRSQTVRIRKENGAEDLSYGQFRKEETEEWILLEIPAHSPVTFA